MKVWIAATLLGWIVAPALAQGQSLPATRAYGLTFVYDRPGLNVPHWQIKITPHSAAEYRGTPLKGVDPGMIFFAISDPGSERLGDLLAGSHDMQPCETKSKGIANMGQKRIDFWPEGRPESHCAFNYTDNKPLSEAADYLIAIANTIQTGVELDRLHRYDRLGLDAVMHRLVADVKEHRAVEVVAIRPTLQRLAEDEALMDRVRAKAQDLLTLASEEAVK
ncbi:hypothetical protein [Terriglobus sp. RCC_193]|uniref:hypothetical protein n=1 Tax=Terriglobus sp. RCC_193 TaxID=3239218 RepID=UPI00352360DA